MCPSSPRGLQGSVNVAETPIRYTTTLPPFPNAHTSLTLSCDSNQVATCVGSRQKKMDSLRTNKRVIFFNKSKTTRDLWSIQNAASVL